MVAIATVAVTITGRAMSRTIGAQPALFCREHRGSGPVDDSSGRERSPRRSRSQTTKTPLLNSSRQADLILPRKLHLPR